MLTERQKKILEYIINEYTVTKKPIGSKEFCQKYFKDLSSATIRREFNFLTVNKYLTQPYWSAGRLPTDKAYQWFIKENLLNREKNEDELDRWVKKLDDWKKLSFEEIAKKISQLCESLTIGYLLNDQLIYRYGLKKFFEQLEEMELQNWESVWEDVDLLDERLKKRIDDLIEEPFQIFIGKESPITRDENLSVISYTVFDDKKQNLLILIGPKNIICERNLNILQTAYDILNGSNLNKK
jgi:transcriptional regulator of heat shock response